MMDVTTMMLPEAFQEKMKALLGGEYGDFIKSYEKERVQGLRFNQLKVNIDEIPDEMQSEFQLKKIPWVKEGYYYHSQSRPGKHAWHEAGVYYIQEPSAMAVVELLDPKPGDVVLDLCGAPGGKTTHIASRMKGEGLLVSNEIHPARVKILSQNVERMGIANAVVTNADSRKLTDYFPEFFDKIVVDAPCSGEGMFRKDEGARAEWSPASVRLCAERQAEILDNAAAMLKGGGRLIYSTCTFSPEENEGSIQAFLERHPEFFVEQVPVYEGFGHGRPEWNSHGREELRHTVRIWPHQVEGEGHYLAVLKKSGNPVEIRRKYPAVSSGAFVLSLNAIGTHVKLEGKRVVQFGDQVYALPETMVDYKGLKVVRPGLHLGTLKKSRMEPSHALALSLNREQACQCYDMKTGEEISRYLKGETLQTEEPAENGWVLMLADGYSLGWAKRVGTTLKNHYPKGLRKP